jgi:hypothetical protein
MSTTQVELEAKDLHGGSVRMYRYLFIEADGTLQVSGRHQRPSALRNAELHGLGVFDAREQEVILQPDVAKRRKKLRMLISSYEKGTTEAYQTLAGIAHLHGIEEES